MSKSTLPLTPTPLELKFQKTPGGEVEAALAVRFCLEPEARQLLKEREVRDPYVLFVIIDSQGGETRYLTPLTAEMEYLQFAVPGENTIHATIVYSHERDEKGLRNIFLKQGAKWYDTSVFSIYNDEIWDFNSSLFPNWVSFQRAGVERLPGEFVQKVVVPPSLFTKPWRLTKGLHKAINHLFGIPSRDPCHFRKRLAALAVPVVVVGPFFVIFSTIFHFVFFALALIAGIRNLNYKWPIALTESPATLVKGSDVRVMSWWFQTKEGKDRIWPIGLAFLMFGLYVLSLGEWLFAVLPLILGSVAVGGTLYAVLGTKPTAKKIASKAANFFDRLIQPFIVWYNKRVEEADRREMERQQAEMDRLVCNGQRPADVRALARQKRTIHLRKARRKAQVCRPYSGV